MTTGLQGKVALVTGGSKGIGKAIAHHLAAEGVRLAICARDERILKQTADEIQVSTRADIIAVKANMTKLNDIHRFAETAMKQFNRIDILVNNAGGVHVGGIFQTTDDEWDYHIQLKLMGYIRMAREVVPSMKLGGGGRIINIVGMAAKEPGPLFMVPGVTNSALLNFTKTLSKELESDRILVNAVNPSTTETPLTGETMAAFARILQKSPEEVKAEIAASSPHGRLATPEDVAAVAVFLASDSAKFINGISLNVDAGRSLGLW